EAVGARAEDGDDVADLGAGQHHLVPEDVVRRGEAAGHRDLLFGGYPKLVRHCDREIAAAALEQAAGRTEQVVATAVGRQEGFAATFRPVDDSGQIHAAFGD